MKTSSLLPGQLSAESLAKVQPRVQAEFIARGIRSRKEARRSGHYVDADVVLETLQRKLDAARVRLSAAAK